MTSVISPGVRLYTVAEIATWLHVDRTTVYRWINSGELPSVRGGRQIRVAESDLLTYLGRSPAQPPASS